MVNLRVFLMLLITMVFLVPLGACGGEKNYTEGYEIVTKQTNNN